MTGCAWTMLIVCAFDCAFSEINSVFIFQLSGVYSSGVFFLYIAKTLPELSNT